MKIDNEIIVPVDPIVENLLPLLVVSIPKPFANAPTPTNNLTKWKQEIFFLQTIK